MKAYNETWVENVAAKRLIEDWFKKNLLGQTELESCQSELSEDFYDPNWFIKIGLFLFTGIAISFSSGIFLALLGVGSNNITMGVFLVIFSVLSVVVLEHFIKRNKLYRSGIDNALLYSAIGFLFTGILSFFNFDLIDYLYPLLLLVILIPALIRYADPLVSVGVFFSFFIFVFLFSNTFSWGKTLLPFIMMALSATVYFVSKSLKKSIYYADVQFVIETMALAVFYLSGNYFVVREANALLNNQSPSVEIPFSLIFWIFTFLVPFIYLYFGARKKQRNAIILGLLGLGFSVFTYRSYYSVMPTEWALTLGGAILIGVSVFCIKYFKSPKFNLSSVAEEQGKLQKLESILVAQAFQTKTSDDTLKFGGGEGGGAGADGKY
ncbi:hypothetical protein EGI26_15110 [Lacihabitans sp. CCS-44]|uniref:hypothetical protein n=1 Tax=Lacihabitans sp. CCS-44 TaxID=2487331 RepID=UPI0020CBA33F|nr:hypothetical protein [Lacihabitans sp. CCS-44]MCP9756492.1 hypothetical protein [Lacihabitans sp. CCS-44]